MSRNSCEVDSVIPWLRPLPLKGGPPEGRLGVSVVEIVGNRDLHGLKADCRFGRIGCLG